MQASRAEKARLGVFILAASSLLAFTLFFLIGRKVMEKTAPYHARFEESVTGLEPGSPIKQNGVDIGTVTSMTTDSSDITKTIVRFAVREDVPVKTDMLATLGSYGITGLKYVEVTGGNYSSPDLRAGGEIRTSMSTLGRITASADSIAFKVDRLLGNIIEITDAQNRGHFQKLVEKSVKLSEAMDSLVRDVQAVHPGRRLDDLLDNADAAMKDVRDKVRKSDVAGTVDEYRKAAEGVTQLTERMDVIARRMQEDLAITMGQMKEAMKNMNTFSRQIKENPSVLIRGEDKQERRQ